MAEVQLDHILRGSNSDGANLGLSINAVSSIRPNGDSIAHVMLQLSRPASFTEPYMLPRYE
jgi:hypothetical protein